MNNLTYGIYYCPNKNKLVGEDINFVCYDNRIHIRFKDFNSEMIIAGFERKLSYLLSYLINYNYIPTLVGTYTDNQIIKGFLKTSDVNEILTCIRTYISSTKIKGFKLSKNYNRKDDCKSFGESFPDCVPLINENGIYKGGDLKTFLKILKLNLTDYLFNDAYIIILSKDKELDVNKKFIDRTNRKLSKIAESNFNVTELW